MERGENKCVADIAHMVFIAIGMEILFKNLAAIAGKPMGFVIKEPSRKVTVRMFGSGCGNRGGNGRFGDGGRRHR